jgi:hypothetical protein
LPHEAKIEADHYAKMKELKKEPNPLTRHAKETMQRTKFASDINRIAKARGIKKVYKNVK